VPDDAADQFNQFVEAYPPARRQRGYMVEHLFLQALTAVGFDVLMGAVTQQKRSEQWENPTMIPMMKKWLEEGRWIQVLPERRAGSDRRQPERQTLGRRSQVPKHEPL
jgi:hypothetical protein